MEYDTIFAAARRAGNELALVDAGRLSRTVAKAAALLRENAGKVLAANALDLEAMDADSPMRDRLRLTAERIASIAADMESVAGLPSPQGETIAEWTRPNGMTLRKVRVPFGVVGMICGHLIFQKACSFVAPSTSAASTRDWSTLPSAETYSTMGWPTEVVSRIRMMQASA